MRMLLAYLCIIFIAFCRLVLSGEVIAGTAGATPYFWRILDYGALGMFTVFLIFDRRHRDKRDEETSMRFHALDERILNAMKDNTAAMSIMTAAANEFKVEVGELKGILFTKPCLRPPGARTRESDRLDA